MIDDILSTFGLKPTVNDCGNLSNKMWLMKPIFLSSTSLLYDDGAALGMVQVSSMLGSMSGTNSLGTEVSISILSYLQLNAMSRLSISVTLTQGPLILAWRVDGEFSVYTYSFLFINLLNH